MNFQDIKNKTVLLRCDFNESIISNTLRSHERIDANIITIHELLARNNKLILISHHSDKDQTMLPVYNYLQNIFSNIRYLNTTNTLAIKDYLELNKHNLADNLILLENTRLFKNENDEKVDTAENKNLDESNSQSFSIFLSGLADCFVFDAFSVGHRDHSSTTGAASLIPACYGPTFLKEYSSLQKILNEMDKTLVFFGGAKLSTKLKTLEKFIEKKSYICLGGAMVHPIIQTLGTDIKSSFIEDTPLNMTQSLIFSSHLILPKDLIWNTEKTMIVDNMFDFEKVDKIVTDQNIKNILWNGPVGVYEKGCVAGSLEIYNYIKGKQNQFRVVGGGDTLAFLESVNVNYKESFSYVSLSGGAMLEFLTKNTLPILNIIKIL